MSENTQLDIDNIGIGVDCVGIDHGCYPIEDAPVYNGKSGNGSTPRKDRIDTFVPVDADSTQQKPYVNPQNNKSRISKRRILGEVGFAIGFISLISAFIPYFQFVAVYLSVAGFVFSMLSINIRASRTRKVIGIIVNSIAFVMFWVMFALYLETLGLYI